MIRRFIYHSFWNFYDHLGTYLLAGVLHTVITLGMLAAASSTASGSFPIALKLLLFFGVGLLAVAATAVIAAGLLYFSDKVAHDEPARGETVKEGVRSCFKPVACLLALALFVFLILGVNIVFYYRIGANAQGLAGLLAVVLAMALVWLGISLLLLLVPALAVAGGTRSSGVLLNLKRSVVIFMLAPSLWVFVALLAFASFVLGVITQIGLIFVLPAIACFSQTAYRLVAQYADHLGEARNILPADSSLRSYKRKAHELGWEWEYRQPRRTFKELIKPWEH